MTTFVCELPNGRPAATEERTLRKIGKRLKKLREHVEKLHAESKA